MIFKSPHAKAKEQEQWHRWFAWHPVTITGSSSRELTDISVWWQYIERKVAHWRGDAGPSYEYRLPEIDHRHKDGPA